MTEYQRGFLEALQAVAFMGSAKFRKHTENALSGALNQEDQDTAISCAATLGYLMSDIKTLGARIHRGDMDPSKIATANGEPYWWATVDGKGRS